VLKGAHAERGEHCSFNQQQQQQQQQQQSLGS